VNLNVTLNLIRVSPAIRAFFDGAIAVYFTNNSLTACKSAGFNSPAAWRSFKVVSSVS
jgi:hypothetical protein